MGKGGNESFFSGEEVGGGGAGSSGGGGDVGKGGGGEDGGRGAGSSGGGREEGRGGVRSFGTGGRSGELSLKHTQESFLSSATDVARSGPKMLSKSAIEGFLLELSPSVDESGCSVESVLGGEGGTFLGGSGGGVPVGKDLVKEELGSDKGAPHTSDSDRTTSVFCSPKADSKEGPNKALVSSETGD